MQYITDLNGNRIEITNLKTAIAQAEIFTGYFLNAPFPEELDSSRGQYWRDIREKLMELE